MSCWICRQRAELRRERKKAARIKAKEQANISRETMVIIKEGLNYRVISLRESVGLKVVETIPGI